MRTLGWNLKAAEPATLPVLLRGAPALELDLEAALELDWAWATRRWYGMKMSLWLCCTEEEAAEAPLPLPDCRRGGALAGVGVGVLVCGRGLVCVLSMCTSRGEAPGLGPGVGCPGRGDCSRWQHGDFFGGWSGLRSKPPPIQRGGLAFQLGGGSDFVRAAQELGL